MADTADNQDVIMTPPEDGAQDELNSILDALGRDDTVVDAPAAASSGDTTDKPFKTVGGHIFQTEADYDSWALRNYGEVNRLTGEANKKPEPTKASDRTTVDVQTIRMQIKVADFFEANPDAVEHKDVIAAILRSGKATTLEAAKIMAFKAMGVEAKEEDNTEDVKNILKAGGGNGSVGEGSYNNSSEVKGTSDFADSALLGRV